MLHYVLLSFAPGFFTDEIFEFAVACFSGMPDEESYIHSVSVKRNCVLREGNMDLMVAMELEDEASLKAYLECRLHKQFVSVVGDHVVTKVAFDCFL